MAGMMIELRGVAELEDTESRLLRKQRVFRDRSSAFDLNDDNFISLFRLDKNNCAMLCEQLQSFLAPKCVNRSTIIPVEVKVLCALRFYATGSYQSCIGHDFMVSVSQMSVSRCIRAASEAINTLLFSRYVKFPLEDREIQQIKNAFMVRSGFPNVIGAIDCTHVAIVAPLLCNGHQEHRFVNRKGFHSINVQLVCDNDLVIRNVLAKYPGSCHDAYIWKSSGLYHLLRSNFSEGINRNTWLVGDSGYPVEPWLLTPLARTTPGTPEARYNHHHIVARNVMERCNDVLKARFRCLSKEHVLHYSPLVAGLIINACVVLHNISITSNIPQLQNEDFQEDDSGWAEGFTNNNNISAGHSTRQHLINTYFTN